jgi:hypothetical protein
MITPRRTIPLTTAVIAAALVLAGCGNGGGEPVDEPDAAASSTATDQPTEEAEEAPAPAPAAAGPQVVFPSTDTSTITQCAIGTWVLEGTDILQAQFGTVEPDATADGYQLFAFDGTTMVTQNHYSYSKPLGQMTMDYTADWDAETSGTLTEDSGYAVADTSQVIAATGQASDGRTTYSAEQVVANHNTFAVRSCDATTMTATGWLLLYGTLRRLG